MEQKHPLPPFTLETALEKIQLAEDGWNSRDPEKVSKAYTLDSRWRNRAEFTGGRAEIGETSQQTLVREMMEELNGSVKCQPRLAKPLLMSLLVAM